MNNATTALSEFRELCKQPTLQEKVQERFDFDPESGDMMVVPEEFQDLTVCTGVVSSPLLKEKGLVLKAPPITRFLLQVKKHHAACRVCNPDWVKYEEASEHYGDERVFCEEWKRLNREFVEAEPPIPLP